MKTCSNTPTIWNCNPEFDELIDGGNELAATDRAEAERLFIEAQEILIEDAAAAFFYDLPNDHELLALSFVYSLTGALLVEVIFAWPGLGSYVTRAILSIDFPVIMAVTLVVTVFYVFINLFLDILQTFLDPRVTLG